jgi:Uncharacterized protein conserved in bacteria
MSEPVLKAILRLFALVAKEDMVTKQERDFIKVFLSDHLSQGAVEVHMNLFDVYLNEIPDQLNIEKEKETIGTICRSINAEMAQKQKTVIMMELMSIVLADGSISSREEALAKSIAQSLNVSESDLTLIQKYVSCQTPQEVNDENLLIIRSSETSGAKKQILREELDGFITVLFVKSCDLFFFKYVGNSDIYLNGVPKNLEISTYWPREVPCGGAQPTLFTMEIFSVNLKI